MRGAAAAPGRLCVLLGSFDPLHRAHEWMARYLLGRFDAVALLIPAHHVHKQIRYPDNATLAQRLALLEDFGRSEGQGRLRVGLARQVLFLQLAAALARRHGGEIWFGLGQGTHARLQDSARYFERAGLPWGEPERQALARLEQRVVIFARRQGEDAPGRGPAAAPAGAVELPPQLRGISSTIVRRAVGELRASSAAPGAWSARLAPLVTPRVVEWIRANGLYTPGGAGG